MKDTLYYIIFGILLVVMGIVVPIFLRAEIPSPCRKSLVLKQTCSTIFVINALLAGIIGGFSAYAILMIVGLCFSWLGDFLLHVRPDPKYFVAGLLSFLVGHIFYTSAYCSAFSSIFPEKPLFSVVELIIYIVFLALVLLGVFAVEKMSLGKLTAPCCLYAATIAAMAVKSFSLAISIIMDSAVPNPIFTGIMLMVGSTCFLLSDYTLSILMFKTDIKKHGALRDFNIWTYFYAQMFLGVTIFFIAS